MKNSLLKKCVAFLFFLVVPIASSYSQTISTYAGGIGEDSSATVYGRLNGPSSVAFDAAGNILISDNSFTALIFPNANGIIRKVNPFTGIINTMQYPYQITYIINDGSGNMYFSTEDNRVCKMDTSGNTTLIAGTGSTGFGGDGSIATAAVLNRPIGLAIDGTGNLYIADANNSRVRKIDTSGIINTIAGGGSTLGDGGLAISAQLLQPTGVAVDGLGNIYIADGGCCSSAMNRIRKVNTLGIISTDAGGGGGPTVDGVPATATTISNPWDVRIDGSGNLYISDRSNGRIRKVNSSGIISTVATDMTPYGITFDAMGNLYVADDGLHRVSKLNTATGILTTIAGNDTAFNGYSGDGGNPLLATFNATGDVAADRFGNLYMIDNGIIRKINASHIVSTFAGNSIIGFSGDGGPATAAELDAPTGICTDRVGNLYIADAGSAHIRKITGSTITTIAGGGTTGLGDGGPATAAEITTNDVAVDSIGNVYIADGGHSRVRKISIATGIISTLAGTGTSGFSGDGGAATIAELANPGSIAVDPKGNVYFADGGNNRVRKIDTSGIITTVAGGGGDSGDGGPATSAAIGPGAITIDKYGSLYVASGNEIRQVDVYGIIHTVAGGGTLGIWSEHVPATATALEPAVGITIDTNGNLFISTYEYPGVSYSSIRKICCLGNVTDRPPLFTHGSTQSISICASSGTNTIDTLMRMSDPDIGQQEKWTVTITPTHGTLTGFPDSALSTGGVITPSGLTYPPTTGFSGTDHFTIQISDGTDYTTTTVTVNINPLATANITGLTSVCSGDSITLTGTMAGGTWSAANGHASVSGTGIVHGTSTGVDTISYTVSHYAAQLLQPIFVTVNPFASAHITGASSVCTGSSITLTGTTAGGWWSSGNTAVATVGTSGAVWGLANAGHGYHLLSCCEHLRHRHSYRQASNIGNNHPSRRHNNRTFVGMYRCFYIACRYTLPAERGPTAAPTPQ